MSFSFTYFFGCFIFEMRLRLHEIILLLLLHILLFSLFIFDVFFFLRLYVCTHKQNATKKFSHASTTNYVLLSKLTKRKSTQRTKRNEKKKSKQAPKDVFKGKSIEHLKGKAISVT